MLMKKIKDRYIRRREEALSEALSLHTGLLFNPLLRSATDLSSLPTDEQTLSFVRECRLTSQRYAAAALRIASLVRARTPVPSLPTSADDPVAQVAYLERLAGWFVWVVLGSDPQTKMKRAHALAWRADRKLESERPELETRRERWKWLREQGTGITRSDGSEYSVPKDYQTFSRYVRQAERVVDNHEQRGSRQSNGEQRDKHGTVVRQDDI